MILRELITKFGFDVDEEKVKKIDSSIDGLKNRMDGLAKKSTQLGKSLTTFVTLPILALGAGMVKVASDAEETESKFGTVFSGISQKAEDTAKNLAIGFGLSSVKAKELLGDTGDLLTGFGFTQEKSLALSKGVQELAVDLASFTNFSGGAEGASQALTKALLGERESIKSLGISILEEDVKKKVALLTAQGMTFETNRQAKAFATLQLAQEQSKNAIGDYARTNQGFANQWRLMQTRISDVAISFGKILLPIAGKVLRVIIKMVEFFGNLSGSTKTLILVIGGLIALLGPLLLLFGFVLTAVGTMIGGFTGLAASIGIANGALLLLMAKFILIGALIAAAFAVIFLVIDDLIAFFRGEDSLTGVIIQKVGEATDFVIQSFKDMGTSVMDEIGSAIDYVEDKFNSLPGVIKTVMAIVTAPIRAAVTMIRTLGGVLGALSGGDIGGAFDAIKTGISDNFDINAVTGSGVGGLLGFGPSQPPTGGNTTNTANAEVTVNVPPGTDPEEAGQFVRQGVSEGLLDIFQETQRQVVSPIAE